MAKPETQRLDELPLDRRIAGKWTKSSVTRATKMSAIYERRDIDPITSHLKRRPGSVRVTNAKPNLLGARTGDNEGSIVIDRDFTTEMAVNDKWTIFLSVHVNDISDTTEHWTRLISFGSTRTYMRRLDDGASGHVVQFRVYSIAGGLLAQTAEKTIDGVYGGDFHVVVASDNSNVAVNAHYSQSPAAWPADVTGSHTFTAEGELSFFGANLAALTPLIPRLCWQTSWSTTMTSSLQRTTTPMLPT